MTHTEKVSAVLEADPIPVEEEPVYNTAWILDSLGAENVSQAALKISGITLLCVIIAVVVITVLDANFVARMKSAEEALDNAEESITANEMIEIEVEDESFRSASMESEIHTGGQGGDGEGLSDPEESRRYLPSSIFGNAYRQLNASLSVVMEGTASSASEQPALEALDQSPADKIDYRDLNLEFAENDSKIFRV